MKRTGWSAILAVIVCAGCASRTARVDDGQRAGDGGGTPRAELVVVNGAVWTGAGADVQGVAIVDRRIAAVGSNAGIQRWIGDRTEVIDAGGRRVIPGITDSHMHIVSGGEHLGRLNLREVTSKEEFVGRVAEAVRETRVSTGSDSTWLTGGRWSVESWTEPASPRKEWIDAVSEGTPVFLSRMDGHQGLANSEALRLAGIDASGPVDPAGGVIGRDAESGEPTGILKDAAMGLVSGRIPAPSEDELYAALLRAMKHVNALGITSVHDMSGRGDLTAMFRAHREGTMTTRIRKYLAVADWASVIEQVKNFEAQDAWFRVPGFKAYMDGSLGSRTAYMYRPYSDAEPDGDYPWGILSDTASPPKRLRWMIERADAAGLQSAVHAIGDEGNHILLDAYASVRRKNGAGVARHRVEHAQHLLPEDIARFAELGVVASMQPYHKADDGRYAEKALGEERLRGSYAFRSLIESGALVVFGSDWPVVNCNPFKGMAAAVTGRTLDGKIWIPEESITIEQALRAYTVHPPVACGMEAEVGTLEVGKLADMVILSRDVLRVDSREIDTTRAVVTIVGGRVVFDER